MSSGAASLYQEDLAHIQALGFGGLARGAAPAILERLAEAAIPVRRVLDVGCGAGLLTRSLAEAGYEVTGIDSSAPLLELARTNAPHAAFIHGSVYDCELPGAEAVIALGEPLTYHSADSDAEGLLRGFIRRCADILPSGGLIIFDVIELGEPPLAGRFWSSGEDWAVLASTTEDQARRILTREIETFRQVGELYRRGREVHTVRLFDSKELQGWLRACGFEVETAQAYGPKALGPRRRVFFGVRQKTLMG
ncbi:MAG TPA: class I SAM-dependent methyltransferase [Bryobacteraceae bacterium]|nr:class I SAM-dependent methyltransferase [Bryobacteraceae bacterium]